MRTFWEPKAPSDFIYDIKKSSFIARADYAESREQAMDVLSSMRHAYPDARHHCWAYQLGSPFSPISAAMNDDGEPSGTAGKPIFNVLQHKDIGNIMVVVSRYFGGIKLGAGGLVRAYSAAAEGAVSQLKLQKNEVFLECILRCDYAKEQQLRHYLSTIRGRVESVTYQEQASLSIAIPIKEQGELEEFALSIGAQIVETNQNDLIY